jgi:hypothetical protein
MSWTSMHLEHDDEIRLATGNRVIPGHVQLHLGGGITFMAPRAKAAELRDALNEALATAPEQDGDA